MSQQLSEPLIHVTGTPPWLLRPGNFSTSSELYPGFSRLPTFFLIVQTSSFLIYLFPKTAKQAPFGYLPLTVQYSATFRTLCHASSHLFLPLNPYLGKQRIFLGVASILSMCIHSHTQLDCNYLLMIQNRYLKMSKSKMFYLQRKV